ncbi:hypothetical protein WICPIJ_002510 [Wickerhamomyces pijperi]|uniref:N-acetyltransferase domain-containing protein n=1 Tax=Wickerhamomyces pijperi TaxID=599730 RepID=A0A9P8Q9K3_WICPI|nr:hypothetical protein WICPIJ_002510 [Wickerhamomyces pijperi]
MSTGLPLHIVIRPLNVTDVQQVFELEKLGFPPSERCSLETLKYRLSKAPELSSGLFIREFKPLERESDAYLPEATTSIIGEKLIGHIIGTKVKGDFITEGSMQCPNESEGETEESTGKGHIESSNTIGVHSIVISPDYQKRNLATLLLHDYIQKLSNQQVAEKISIIAKEYLLPFYSRVGFVKKGPSDCTHGGEEWFDLQCPLIPEDYEE